MGATISSVLMTGAEAGRASVAVVARVTNGERVARLSSLSSKVSWRALDELAWGTVSTGYWSSGVMERRGAAKSKTVVVGLTKERSYGVPVAGGLSRLYVSQKETVARSVRESPSKPGGCEELTTSSFRSQAREARGNEGRNRRGRRGGARRIYPQEYRRRRGRGCRSECRVDLHLKGTSKKMDEVRSEDEGDDYQGGIDNDEDGESNGIQVGS